MKQITLIAILLVSFATNLGATWKYIERKDPITDKPSQAVGTMDEHEHILYFQKASSGYGVIFHWGRFFAGERGYVIVEYRFDNEPHREENWMMLGGNRSAFIHSSDAINFIRKARNSKVLLIRVTDPMDSDQIIARFSLEGLEAAMEEMKAAR